MHLRRDANLFDMLCHGTWLLRHRDEFYGSFRESDMLGLIDGMYDGRNSRELLFLPTGGEGFCFTGLWLSPRLGMICLYFQSTMFHRSDCVGSPFAFAADRKDPENNQGKTGGAFTDEPVRLLGYFALMQLLRLHSLLGDYHTALKTIECLDFGADVPLFYQIPACHVTLYYYMGFAYVMMRRYADAIHTFSDILVFLSKTSSGNAISYQYDQILKKQDVTESHLCRPFCSW